MARARDLDGPPLGLNPSAATPCASPSNWRTSRSPSDFRRANPRATYMMRMVTATAKTMTDPSLARIVGSRSRGRMAIRNSDGRWGGSFAVPVLHERVADPVDRSDVPWLGGLVAKLPPDPGHVGIHHPPPGVVAVPPHPVHELVPAEHHAWVPSEREEDLELERGERHLRSRPQNSAPCRVDDQVEPGHRLGGRGQPLDAVHPADDGAHPGSQLAQAERL